MPDVTPCVLCHRVGFVRKERVIKADAAMVEYYCGGCEHSWTAREAGERRVAPRFTLHGQPAAGPPVVAVVNSSPTTIAMLARELRLAGFGVVTTLITHVDRLIEFLREHKPRVVVWDIAVPYQDQWAVLEQVRRTDGCAECHFVVTTTNAAHVAKLAGREERIYEIVGEREDLEAIVRAAREAARAKSTR